MTRYLLDTNVISDLAKPTPPPRLAAWAIQQADDDLHISALTLAELRRGILQKPHGRRREELEAWFSGPAGPVSLFRGRILPFDDEAALVWARLMAEGTSIGRPRSGIDTIIAAIAERFGCVLVTANEKHFPGIEIVNPLRDTH